MVVDLVAPLELPGDGVLAGNERSGAIGINQFR